MIEAPNNSNPKLKLSVLILFVICGCVVFQFTPLKDYLTVDNLSEYGNQIWRVQGGPAILTFVMVVSLCLMVPVNLVSVVIVAILPALPATVLSLIAALLASAVGFWTGKWLGAEGVSKYFGKHVEKIRAHPLLEKSGILTVALFRNLPVAPFMVVNIAAGAIRIRFRDFILGSALGMLPGKIAIAFFADELKNAAKGIYSTKLYILGGVFLAFIGLSFYIARKYGGTRPKKENNSTKTPKNSQG